MRILHTEWSDGWGGQEQRIVSEMRGMQARGHELILLTRPEAQIREKAEAAGIETLTLPFRNAADLPSSFRLARLARRRHVDLINTHSGVDSWIGGLAARLSATPLVRTRHLNIPLKRRPSNFVHYLPARIIACGDAVRARLVDECGFPASQVVSIPTGIDFSTFKPARERSAVRTQENCGKSDEIVLMVGVIRGVKRHLLALDVIARLVPQRPRLRLWIAGDGPMRAEVEARTRQLRLEERVHFLGYREDVPDLMQAADALLLTSRSEGVPQVITQALGLGLPVVSTRVGSVSELIDHERTGLLGPPEDADALAHALARLLDHPAWARQLAANGQAHVRAHYSLEAMLDATEKVYAQALEDKS